MQPVSDVNRRCAGTEGKLGYHLLEKGIAGWGLLQWLCCPWAQWDPEEQCGVWLAGVESWSEGNRACSGGIMETGLGGGLSLPGTQSQK